MMHFLTIGTVLGISAGFAPGPLLTLVVSETLQHDIRSGIKVAIAPIVTDLPIIILTLFILSKLSAFHAVMGIISMAGGLFILSMGYQGIRTNGVTINVAGIKANPFAKGVLANALSPHPYLFWFSVGAPTMTRAMGEGISAPLAFIISFYLFLVGSKIMLAILIGKSKSLLSGRGYIYTMRFIGVLLCMLAFALFHDGLELLAII